jgi:hypothetical protein
MRRITAIVFAVLISLLALPALAQEKKPDDIGRVYSMVPKAGMVKQFEDGRKRHMDFHRKSNDTWTWLTWEITTGPATGSYFSTTFGHTWKDFDTWEAKLGAGDAADGAVNLDPYIASGVTSIWMVMPAVSRMPESMTPPKMQDVSHFMLKPGHEDDFNYAIRKITEGINKTNWPAHYVWYMLVNGGEGPHYVLTIPHENWADMAEPDPPFPVMLEKAFGRHEAEELMEAVGKAVAHQWTEMVTLRADLSYMPNSK